MARTTKIINGVTMHRSVGGIYRDAEGFDTEGRDPWGRDRDGFSKSGWRHSDHTHSATGTRFDPEGYDHAGFNALGINRKGRRLGEAVKPTGKRAVRPTPVPTVVMEPDLDLVPEEDVYEAPEAVVEVVAEPKVAISPRPDEDAYISPMEARAYMLSRARKATHGGRTDIAFTAWKVVARWDSRFRDDVRDEEVQHAFRLYAATREDWNQWIGDGLMRSVGSSEYMLTKKGSRKAEENYRLWRAASGIIADMHRWH